MLVKHYRELWVYQRAFKAAMRIFELSKTWPSEERYSLTDQIRRSSRSVCGAIAEAWRKRRYQAHFVSKLSDGDSEAAETQNWLAFALKCGYLAESESRKLDDEYDAISAGLVNMMDNASQWCGPGHAVREDSGEYVPNAAPAADTACEQEGVGVSVCGRVGVAVPSVPHSNTPTRPDVPTPTRPHAHTSTRPPSGGQHA